MDCSADLPTPLYCWTVRSLLVWFTLLQFGHTLLVLPITYHHLPNLCLIFIMCLSYSTCPLYQTFAMHHILPASQFYLCVPATTTLPDWRTPYIQLYLYTTTSFPASAFFHQTMHYCIRPHYPSYLPTTFPMPVAMTTLPQNLHSSGPYYLHTGLCCIGSIYFILT